MISLGTCTIYASEVKSNCQVNMQTPYLLRTFGSIFTGTKQKLLLANAGEF